MQDTHSGARHFATVLERDGRLAPGARVLVVGCGQGHEARFLRERLGAEITAIEPELSDAARALAGDGMIVLDASVLEMPFPDARFDAVFYHHVIEHVGDAAGSLREIARVLRPGGWLYVGTPNRHRLVGYVGSFDASLPEKIRWNVADYRARLRGRFRNDFGAHAGFAQGELARLLARHFRDIRELTEEYLRFKYGARLPKPAMAVLRVRPVREVLAPSVYAICRR